MSVVKNIMRDVREVYDSRNVLRSLVAKNLYGKYKNSFLGFAWNFISPIIMMLMYYIIFTEIRTGPSSIENRWLFISTAIFLFSFLNHCVVGGTGAFTGNAGMIKKMYIPKEIFVLANAISSMIVCIIGTSVVFVAMIFINYPINIHSLLILPVVFLLAFIFGIGCIFLLSTITVYVRDIQYALGSIGIALFIMTPMRYMAADATGLLSTIIWYNPLTYYIESIHEILYFSQLPDAYDMLMCVLLACFTLILGYSVFYRYKNGFIKRL